MNILDTLQALESGKFDICISKLYACEDSSPYRIRLMNAVHAFQSEFNADDSTEIALFSVPGRIELAGNHTDHQGSCVLAGTINADMIAVASPHNDQEIHLKSEDQDLISIDLSVPGFDVYITSDIPEYAGRSEAVDILIDMLSGDSQIIPGGVIAIDFKSKIPEFTQISVDLQKYGYALCMIDSGADHTDFISAYTSIPAEMNTIAKMFSREKLSEISKDEFLSHLSGLRRTCGDRAVLRTMHYFAENERVSRQIQALQNGNFTEYLQEVTVSGLSSFRYLQNVIASNKPENQEVAVTIALCEQILNGQGAVHGGGFAGMVQAYVPLDFVDEFKMQMEILLGVNRCHLYQFRSIGGIQFTIEQE